MYEKLNVEKADQMSTGMRNGQNGLRGGEVQVCYRKNVCRDWFCQEGIEISQWE